MVHEEDEAYRAEPYSFSAVAVPEVPPDSCSVCGHQLLGVGNLPVARWEVGDQLGDGTHVKATRRASHQYLDEVAGLGCLDGM